MDAAHLTSIATRLVDGFDSNAHQLIALWRDSSERLGAAARQRWDAAMQESSPELSAETRRNARHAQKVFAGYYGKAVAMGTSSAEVAVNTVVHAARNAIGRAVSRQQARA